MSRLVTDADGGELVGLLHLQDFGLVCVCVFVFFSLKDEMMPGLLSAAGCAWFGLAWVVTVLQGGFVSFCFVSCYSLKKVFL